MSKKKSSLQLFPFIMIVIGVGLILASVFWVVRDEGEQRRLAVNSNSTELMPYPEIRRVSIGDAKAAFDLNQAVFLDVRGEPYFSEGHIPGAISIAEDDIPSHLNELNPGTWIITYCT